MTSYEQVEWLRSNKGGAKIIHKGYMYTIHKKRYGKIRWRCAQRTLHCKGSITTGSGPTVINLPHNHVPDMNAVTQARCRTFQMNETDENDCPVDVIPLLSNSFSLHGTSFTSNPSADHNIDNDLNESNSTFEMNQSQGKSILKPQLKSPQKIISTPDIKGAKSSPSDSVNSETEMCLRWNSHHVNMQTVFPSLMENERYVDVTLAAEGQFVKCHRLILSSCSEYFDNILKDTYPMQHTVIYLKDTPFWIIKALVDFMYKGEVNIDQFKLELLLKAAEDLQIKGLAGKEKIKKEPEPEKKVPPPKEQPRRNSIEKELKREYESNSMDTNDEEYFPDRQLKKKIQPSKKIRKRKIATPPDPSLLKHVKINLKGTKSRPNIKQPKFYDPDYPEYDPDRCVSPPKSDTDPVFNIDNIKMEPIDFEVPNSPIFSEMSTLMDQSLSETAALEKVPENKDTNIQINTKPSEIRDYTRKPKPTSEKKSFTSEKQIIFESTSENIEITPCTSKDESIKTFDTSSENALINLPTKIVTEAGGKPKELNLNKATIFVNVKRESLQSLDSSSIQKIIDAAKQNHNTPDSDKTKYPQIRVRNLPTTDNVLKKFATAQLTSILKKDASPIIVKKIATKPAILRHSLPKKIEIVKAENTEIAEKLSVLAKTKKELISTETDDKVEADPLTDNTIEKIDAQKTNETEN